jgi:NADH-quinone oxidoreductase subunit E
MAILNALEAGETPKTGTQEPGRHTVEPLGGPTTLVEMVTSNHDYRKDW